MMASEHKLEDFAHKLSGAWFSGHTKNHEEEEPKKPAHKEPEHKEKAPDEERHVPKQDKVTVEPPPEPLPPGPPDQVKVIPLGPDGKPLQQ